MKDKLLVFEIPPESRLSFPTANAAEEIHRLCCVFPADREQYKGNVATINQGAGIAAGGANRGAAISAGGVNKAYALELEANKIQFNTTNTAAGQIKEANLEASRMRELSTVISGMARDMDRRIEEGMRRRY